MSVVRAEAELAELLVLELFLTMAEQPDAENEESMSHADDRDGLELAPETQSRIDELFGGQTCHRCGGPAERLVRERFYCLSHYLRKQPQAASPPRVYRCSAA